jgi:radical SAM/Cys-rich protein
MGKALPTLQKQGSELASPEGQLRVLGGLQLERSFQEALTESGLAPFETVGISVLQINVGKKCNQTCTHCHVDAGPDRDEVMPDEVVDALLSVLERTEIPTLDITGGAPELHPRFREIVTRARGLGRHVMDRCNLTILTVPRFADLPEFLAEHQVEIVASLPHYSSSQTNAQRGDGVYEKSILALRRLNDLGYGKEGTGLELNLVTNPVGALLPACQEASERDWKEQLRQMHGIEFNNLFAITNMPISRFLEYLLESGNLEMYMDRLVKAYSPCAAASVMCKNTLSVGWDGVLYDCDFNQMLDLPVTDGVPRTIQAFDEALLAKREIVLGPHCFGCAAGQGSSCGGATVELE